MSQTVSLDVPHFFQTKGMPHCGPTCTKMVMAYHGQHMELPDIVTAMGSELDETGINQTGLGTFLLHHGFEVVIILWMKLFPNLFIRWDSIQRSHFEFLDWCSKNRNHADVDVSKFARNAPKFLEAGGVIMPRPVSRQDIRDALKFKVPPILNLDMRLLYAELYGIERLRIHHYVVPTAISATRVTVNNPSNKTVGIEKYSIDRLLYASYTHTAGAIFARPHK